MAELSTISVYILMAETAKKRISHSGIKSTLSKSITGRKEPGTTIWETHHAATISFCVSPAERKREHICIEQKGKPQVLACQDSESSFLFLKTIQT
jgi:hypothetical protein